MAFQAASNLSLSLSQLSRSFRHVYRHPRQAAGDLLCLSVDSIGADHEVEECEMMSDLNFRYAREQCQDFDLNIVITCAKPPGPLSS
jgi:hypothetical protein